MSDLIKRKDAIKAIHNYWKKRLDTLLTKESEYGEVYADIQQVDKILEHNKTLCNFINAIPSADRPQGWIPCSERLPEEDTNVLISYRHKEGEGDTSHVYIDITSYGDMYFGGRKVEAAKHWRQPFDYFTSNYEVIAWMPLPKPWKGANR